MKVLSKEKDQRVQFELTADPGGLVFVAGAFNNWNPTANPLKDNPDSGHYKTSVRIAPGTHEYKFVVNGVWTVDPNCANWAPNGFGSLNSVMHVLKGV